jgi:hypothetical protein
MGGFVELARVYTVFLRMTVSICGMYTSDAYRESDAD